MRGWILGGGEGGLFFGEALGGPFTVEVPGVGLLVGLGEGVAGGLVEFLVFLEMGELVDDAVVAVFSAALVVPDAGEGGWAGGEEVEGDDFGGGVGEGDGVGLLFFGGGEAFAGSVECGVVGTGLGD